MVFLGHHFGTLLGRLRPTRGQKNGGKARAAHPALEMSDADCRLRQAGPELWGAVMREGPSPAEDTHAALQAIRESLDAARRLRFAGEVTADERRRLTALAAEAAATQERALRLWAMGRGLNIAGDRAESH